MRARSWFALALGGVACGSATEATVADDTSPTAPLEPAFPPSAAVDAGTESGSATTPPSLEDPGAQGTEPPPPLPVAPVEPDAFAAGEVSVEVAIKTSEERHAISSLIYGMNAPLPGSPAIPPDVLALTTFVRRGGDRSNAYNWETNLSNGAEKAGWANDMWLAQELAHPNAPGELDRVLLEANIAGGRRTMVPFVLNDYVAGTPGTSIPYDQAGFDIGKYFRRVELEKPSPFATTPDLTDGVVYTDEHIDFLRRQFAGDVLSPGPTELMIGSDNEPDLYVSNFPMLQRGSGAPIHAENGVKIGNRLTADDFTKRFIRFAKRVKQIAPRSTLVGPDHFHFDGYTNFHTIEQSRYTDDGRWYVDDFLTDVRAESDRLGVRLLDTWDFHWYPQEVFGGTDAWKLDDAARRMTGAEIEAVLQGPRSYWDPDYYEHSWITDDHLHAPARILVRLRERLTAAWPDMPLGVTEYFPGGCSHVSSALGVADTLGVFGRMGVHMAAMWPHSCDLTFAYGGFRVARLLATTSVRVEHPEKAESSVFAAIDAERVTVLVINKTRAKRSFGLRVFHDELASVDVHLVDAAHPTPAKVASGAPLSRRNAHVYEAPPLSASVLVFQGSTRP